jgi:hypothetical protein
MPWLPFYASQDDLPLVNAALFADGDVALLMHEGENQWRAVLDRPVAADGRYHLWHVPSGPLPLMPAEMDGPVGSIDDPFAGWTHLRVTDGHPFFGSHVGIFWLNLHVSPRSPGSGIGLSSIEWIGNHFWAIGREAPAVTKKRWDKLRRQFARLGPKVPRGGLESAAKPEVFALPAALKELEGGASADTSPL